MITSFDDAWAAVLGVEKGYSNDPRDPGGATMYGVTERVARANGYQGDMRNLPLDQAKRIAKSQYWDLYQCDQFSPAIAFQIFDAAYNGGHPAQWLQQAAGTVVDGNIGAKTIAAVRSMNPDSVILRFLSYRLSYMASLGAWESFGKGWARRIASNMLQGASQ